MKNNLLSGMKILDLSHRLPGPLGGKVLLDQGAEVIKVEDLKFKDPFIYGLFAEMDESFPAMYDELNSGKQIVRLDFKDPETPNKIKELLDQVDGIIMGIPPKLRERLGVTDKDIKAQNRAIGVVELFASNKVTKSMHDINAMAISGLLALHVEGRNDDIVDPPYLPISGINFGVKAAFDLMCAICKARDENTAIFAKSYLLESTEEIFGPFWPKKTRDKMTKFLHNGRYPCYSIYKTKDNKYVALGAVEKKFWNTFCEIFSLDIPATLRFNPDKRLFQKISERFKSLNRSEIIKMSENEDICLSEV
ncbi:MAG: CoA transferase [Deltaproteobacteria bacterium]|nr:MAG: CoA transferase [Deltaproteobacteria bacterium]